MRRERQLAVAVWSMAAFCAFALFGCGSGSTRDPGPAYLGQWKYLEDVDGGTLHDVYNLRGDGTYSFISWWQPSGGSIIGADYATQGTYALVAGTEAEGTLSFHRTSTYEFDLDEWTSADHEWTSTFTLDTVVHPPVLQMDGRTYSYVGAPAPIPATLE